MRNTLNRLRSRFSRRARRKVKPLDREQIKEADAIITCNEVTDRHGTGVILSRIFGQNPNVLSIRSTKLYPEHSLGEAQLIFRHHGLSRRESFERVLFALHRSTVRRVLCVPYHPDELITAIVLKELFGAPLCTFVMDDNNIHSRGIPDELMQEALSKSDLRLAISPELRDAYEQKYGFKFWILPPIVRSDAVQTIPQIPPEERLRAGTGVLIGTLWSRAWLQKLRQTVRNSGHELHWYGNARAHWLKVTADELKEDGIIDCGFLPEAELTQRLKQYAYAVVPTGTLDADDDRQEIARLSLPTRLPYLLAVANLPTIVLGHPAAAAARFLQRFKMGCVCPYETPNFKTAVRDICRPETQLEVRQNLAARSKVFSSEGLAEWVWKSMAAGEPTDQRFERAFCRERHETVNYIEGAAPKDLRGDFILVYHALRRLWGQGFAPDFVLDVGASSGVWSDVAKRIFPLARYLLVEPLHARYLRLNDWYFRKHPDFESIPVAVSDRRGEAEFHVSADLYGSSLVASRDVQPLEVVKVPVCRLDDLAREKKIKGRGLLKVDVQFAEHLVLAGAKEFVGRVDALVLEMSLTRYAEQAILFQEMCELVQALGFRYYEDVGGWRSPVDGTLLQKDVLFVRENLFVEELPTRRPAVDSANDQTGRRPEPLLEQTRAVSV